jgi:hypothetical protein
VKVVLGVRQVGPLAGYQVINKPKVKNIHIDPSYHFTMNFAPQISSSVAGTAVILFLGFS